MKLRRLLAACAAVSLLNLVATLAPAPQSTARAAVSGTRHNLSVSGPGTRKATGETEICLFCHAPHNVSPSAQLWNRRMPATTYTPYTSATRKSAPGQPNGASLLCLSCHDGTIALGEVLSRTAAIAMSGGALSGNSLLGANLSDDHPVSFVYDAALRALRGELADPTALTGPVRLDSGGRLQCTSCHDPHDETNPKFLVVANTASALCTTCHQKNYWTSSDHRNSTRTWNGAGANPWPHSSGTTVAANACENCHRPHTAEGASSLLNHATEETNCTVCHNGNAAAKNVLAEFSKASAHDVAGFNGVHSAAEASPPTAAHVECADCHNPHAARATTLPAKGGGAVPALPGSLEGVRGVNSSGIPVNPAQYEYEICVRCHGSNNPVSSRTARQINTLPMPNDVRLEFDPATARSYHPVAAVGKGTNVPSLSAPWTSSSRMTCTDCHNNNAGPYSTGTGTTPSGSGVNGAHGSTYPMLLERQYVVADNTSESATAYALCYKCHNRNSILSDQSGSFRLHNKHVVGERAPCNVCHDPHGVGSAGSATRNARLINFQTSVVTPSGSALYWERVGTTGGRCYLVCHGENHNPLSY